MDSSSIDLPGSEIENISADSGEVVVHFSKAFVIKTMSGSVERTRWRQAGKLVFTGAEVEGEIPSGSLVCEGGDVGENIYTYRDMIPIPLKSAGRANCDLRFQDRDDHLKVEATGVELIMKDRPYYIEHIKPDA